MGVYCVIGLVFVHAVLGLESQGTDNRAVKLPTCQEITSAIAINQLTLLKMMGGGSHPSTGMAEMEELREEAAARDAKLQEIEKVIEDIKAMIENDVQETLKGVAAQQAALRLEMTSEVNALREEIAAQGRLLERMREVLPESGLMGGLQDSHSAVTEKSEVVDACPDGWLRRESSCYLIVHDTDRTWEDSLAYCKGRGGDLAKITNEEEQQFITAHLGTRNVYWIGLNDRETERHFVWTDGTLPTYTRWAEGLPYGVGGVDCVFMFRPNVGKWHDNTCSGTFGAVCERPVHA